MVATMAMTGAASANAFTHFFKDLGHKIEAQNKKTNRAFVNAFGKKLPNAISKSKAKADKYSEKQFSKLVDFIAHNKMAK